MPRKTSKQMLIKLPVNSYNSMDDLLDDYYIKLNDIEVIKKHNATDCIIQCKNSYYIIKNMNATQFVNYIKKQNHQEQFNIKMDQILKQEG